MKVDSWENITFWRNIQESFLEIIWIEIFDLLKCQCDKRDWLKQISESYEL